MIDNFQGVTGCFFSLPGSDGYLEFLEELPNSTVLGPWKNRGAILYHIGFEVDNLELAIGKAKSLGAVLVSPPTIAPAFPGQNVAFIFVEGMLLEFIGN